MQLISTPNGVTINSTGTNQNVAIDAQAGALDLDGHSGVTINADATNANITLKSDAGAVDIDGDAGVTINALN